MNFVIQNRWKLEEKSLVYYGLRNKANLLKNKTRLTRKQRNIIKNLPSQLDDKQLKTLGPLIGEQIVLEKHFNITPKTFKEARFCKECIANDFIIPGMQFDGDGLCPFCQTKELTAKLKSVVPVMNIFPKSSKSRFDIGLFYTGGKDSTYLLYYLAKELNLRVLAMTWDIPFMSESAKQSIENAKSLLKNVEFINRKINDNDMKTIYKKLYTINENTCACPALAYILFYPELVINKVPYFVLGNEPVQLLGLYYNNMAPKIAYTFADNKLLNFLINVGRILTFRPPFKKGQFQTHATMKQLAYGDSFLKRISRYKNELTANVITAIKEVPAIVTPLKRAIRSASWNGHIPRFVHIDLNEIAGGKYNWNVIKDLIIKECGWVAPTDTKKGLHTSCKIEKCKEHSQFHRFYYMRSKMIPFSAIEIALASRDKNISKDEALYELELLSGFTLENIPECKIMTDYLKDTK